MQLQDTGSPLPFDELKRLADVYSIFIQIDRRNREKVKEKMYEIPKTAANSVEEIPARSARRGSGKIRK